jgi:predicted CXXCH cytochrome family protein
MDGCRSCHQIHGSPNRHLLTHSRQINLCYECHSGANTPGFHGAEQFLNEKCTACHTAIHGSNTNQLFLEE